MPVPLTARVARALRCGRATRIRRLQCDCGPAHRGRRAARKELLIENSTRPRRGQSSSAVTAAPSDDCDTGLEPNGSLAARAAPAERPGAVRLARPGHRLDQFANALGAGLPALLLVLAGWQLWDSALHWQDLVIFELMLLLSGFGITVGFHRLFTHRSFETSRFMRGLFAILGSMALEGPVIEWVAYHRRHHAFSDQEGDPHSPHVGHGSGFRGAIRGLFYAHVGWVVFSSEPAEEERYAKDLLKDPLLRFIDRTFILWALAGLALPFGLGVAMTGTVTGGLTGLLWGGAVRIFVLHHITFSINSICHFFGTRRFVTDDESGNVAWLSVFTLGEAWHHNHHAFPTSAFHGLRRAEIDPSAYLIRALERLGLVWNVVRISPARMASKQAEPATG